MHRVLHLALSVYPGYVLVYSLKCGGGKQELQERRKVESSVASLKTGSWQNEEMNTHFRPSQTNGQLSLTAAVFLWGWECLGEFIYMATTDHYLALWKERKSIRQPHKNHLNTSRILRGRPSGKKNKKKQNRHGMTALFSCSLRSWLFSHSSSLSAVPQCGGTVYRRENASEDKVSW